MLREYTTQNQVQIVCVIKCNEFSKSFTSLIPLLQQGFYFIYVLK